MKAECEAHHTLSMLFIDVGVPNQMIMDGAKTQTLGEFRRKARDTDCRVKQTEPYITLSPTLQKELYVNSRRPLAVNSQHPKALSAYGMTA